MIIVLLGAPGAGKGTVGNMLARDWNVPKIATGDMFREEVARATPLGTRIEHYLRSGKLVPNDVVNVDEIVAQRITQHDCMRGFVLDGYPRTLAQAEALTRFLASVGRRLTAVVNIHVDENELVARLSARRICRQCGAIYNLVFAPKPKSPNCCDACGGELYQRPDEREDVVRHRLKVYEEQTAPLIAYYKKRGLLRSFDGTGKSPEQNYAQLLDVLRDVLPPKTHTQTS